jgi:hypothetical protein
LAKNAQTFLFLSLIFLLLWIYMFWMIFLAWGWWITLQMVECDFFPLIVLGRYITCKKMFVGFNLYRCGIISCKSCIIVMENIKMPQFSYMT